MELTQQNLLRVGDIVAEIERNLASLKRQAAKAERYVAYRGELEDLQLHEASHRYLELVGWIKLEGGGRGAHGGRRELRHGARAREAELEATRLEVHAAEETLEAAQNASFAADNAVRAEEAAIERAKDRLDGAAQRERQAEGEKTRDDRARRRVSPRSATRRERSRALADGGGRAGCAGRRGRGQLADLAAATARRTRASTERRRRSRRPRPRSRARRPSSRASSGVRRR